MPSHDPIPSHSHSNSWAVLFLGPPLSAPPPCSTDERPSPHLQPQGRCSDDHWTPSDTMGHHGQKQMSELQAFDDCHCLCIARVMQARAADPETPSRATE